MTFRSRGEIHVWLSIFRSAFIKDLSSESAAAERLDRSDKISQIGPITALLQRLCQINQLFAIDKALPEGDLLKARNLHALPRFKRLDETCGVDQRLKGPCIEPRKSSSHPLHVKCAGR